MFHRPRCAVERAREPQGRLGNAVTEADYGPVGIVDRPAGDQKG